MMTAQNPRTLRPVYIVDGKRTPYLKAKGVPGPFTAADLAVRAGSELLWKYGFSPETIDEVILGCVMPSQDEANIARIVALRLGCGKQTPAWTVQRNCASGLQSLDCAYQSIGLGRSELVLAGGTEAMSRAPLLFREGMVHWLGRWYQAKTFKQRLQAMGHFRPHFLVPIIALLRGLTDPLVGLSMGQTAENLAYRFKISREEMDAFSVRSHQRLARAIDENQLAEELMTLYDTQGRYYTEDDGLRRDTSLEKLAKLKPFFDKKFGLVTAGNSSQVTDGAAMLLLASEVAVKQHKLSVLAKIVDVQWAGVDPSQMGLGPAHAIPPILQRQKLTLEDIDYWEINEAFAAQVIACLRAWSDEQYCQENLGLDKPLGQLDEERLNIDGGAIAIGHPVGSSGARLILHLANILHRKNARYGIASLCIGGGQGGAMLIERVDRV